jgi:hypothetical protein
MSDTTFSFPHPVLGHFDDVQGNTSMSLHIERLKDTRQIQVNYKELIINNDYFKLLVADGRATVVTKVYCSSSFKTWTFLGLEADITISEDDLVNKAEISSYLIATVNIEHYFDETFNADFGDCKFFVNESDVIAILGRVILPIEKEYEKMGVGNIFEFIPYDNSTDPIRCSFNSDKIKVCYPISPEGYYPPTVLFRTHPWAAYNIFVIPALMEAFRLKSDPEQREHFKDYEWSLVLDVLLPEDEREEDAYANAQLILNRELPMLKAFVELQNM